MSHLEAAQNLRYWWSGAAVPAEITVHDLLAAFLMVSTLELLAQMRVWVIEAAPSQTQALLLSVALGECAKRGIAVNVEAFQ